MSFSSPLFLFGFLPVILVIYWLTIKDYKNYAILFSSCIFFLWMAPNFFWVLFLSIMIDWHLGNKIYEGRDGAFLKRYYLFLILIINVLILFYFKYMNFFVDNLNKVLVKQSYQSLEWAHVLMPVGISFIVFHKISYVVDIYLAKAEPVKRLSDYALYILLFPKLLAGPIVQFNEISNQLTRRHDSIENVIYGVYRFSIGLTKKVLIADSLAIVANKAFQTPVSSLDWYSAWLGVVCYTFQIYFDFSGYSDMAIGIGKIFGFNIPENFNMPYISKSITEFWRRWHITLSAWMKNYLYIPMGGKRCSKLRNYFNLWFVFLVSGLWHGANWTFIVWGIYHGLFLILDKVVWLRVSSKFPKYINILLTFFLVMIGWIFFRSESITQAVGYIVRLFSYPSVIVEYHIFLSSYERASLLTAALISLLPSFFWFRAVQERIKRPFAKHEELVKMAFSVLLLLVSSIAVVSSDYKSFIYFNF